MKIDIHSRPINPVYFYDQTFIVTGLDGNPATLDLRSIQAYIYATAVELTIFGFSLGFVSVVFIALLVVSSKEKIRKPVFLLYLASQFFLAIRAISAIIILCSPIHGIGEALLDAVAQYSPSIYYVGVISILAVTFFYNCILAVLILQVRGIFAAERRIQTVLTAIGVLAALVMDSFLGTWAAANVVMQLYGDYNFIESCFWTYVTFRIYFSAFIAISCSIFLYKLAVTIYDRRKLGRGMVEFGSLQITFVMFTLSLILPRTYYSKSNELII